MASVELRRTDSSDSEFLSLVSALTTYLAEINGESDGFYAHFNRLDTIPNVVIGSVDGTPVGCGAFRPKDDGVVEIKRMYVDPISRGQGVGAAVLRELESWAVELGHTAAILETSKRLEPAVLLYQKAGYEITSNYGPYVGVEDSVCMRKPIS